MLAWNCPQGSAQTSGTLVNSIIPPAPASAVFRQFAGYTPGLATGTVNIPIELYTIQAGAFSLPFSLQYYTQGIRYTDAPYPVGYGWIFAPGLRITRTILGRPDMYFPMDLRASNDFDYYKSAVYDEESHKHPSWESRQQLIDTQHDVFTLHLPHGNYTFLLENEGEEWKALTTNNRLRIKLLSTDGFEVTDGDGTVYCFGESSESKGPYVERYHNRYTTAWMLRKIVLPGDGREINLTWEKVRHSALRNVPGMAGDILQDYKQIWNASIPHDRSPEYTSAEEYGLLTEWGEYEEVLHLKKVEFPGGTVELTNMEVLNPLLTRIVVKNTAGTVVKEIDLGYGTGDDRALLQYVRLSGEGTYRFGYDPMRFSGNANSQDYWGYYNGRDNHSLVPRMQLFVYNTRFPEGSNSFHYYATADRSIDADAMKACLLTRVTYPTGGYTAFEYEPHRFEGSIPQTEGLGMSSKFRLTEGGGLRVKRTVTAAGDGAPAVTKTYKYGPGENGLANVLLEPTLDTFIDELGGYTAERIGEEVKIGYNLRLLMLNPQSNYMRYSLNTPPLWYDTVTEYTEGGGKTEYRYSRITPENQTARLEAVKHFPYKVVTHYNTLFSKGCLLSGRTDYRKTDTGYAPVRKTTYRYAQKDGNIWPLHDKFVTRTGLSLFENGPDFYYENGLMFEPPTNITGFNPERTYTESPCTFNFYYEELTDEETVHYTETDSLTEHSSFTYSHGLLLSRSVICSNGDTLSERYYHPGESFVETNADCRKVLEAMYEKNIQTPVFLTVRTRNGRNEKMRTEFAAFGSNLYRPRNDFYSRDGGIERLRRSYDYDTAGNLRGVTESGGRKHTFLWGYDRTLPVAHLEGLDYADVLGLAGKEVLDRLDDQPGSMAYTLETIRQKTDGQALVNTFLHQPLVGVTQRTAPNGEKNGYEYDSMKRLKSVTDHHAQTVRRFAYRYGQDDGLSVNFSTAPHYAYRTVLNISATVTGGSEHCRYDWRLTDGTGTVLQTVTVTDQSTVSISLQRSGDMTLSCTVTDLMTGETAAQSRSFNVRPETICFTEVRKGAGTAWAQISLSESRRISFYLITELEEGSALFRMDGSIYTLYEAGGTSLEMELEAGTHQFDITVEGRGRAGLYITGADGGSLVEPSMIQAEY